MSSLTAGSYVTVKVSNIMWPMRHRYDRSMFIPEHNTYTGTVVIEKHYKADEIGLTTGDPNYPIRVLNKERVFEINDAEVSFEPPAKKETNKDRVVSVQGSKGAVYQVTVTSRGASCSCSGYQFRKRCKHVDGVIREISES